MSENGQFVRYLRDRSHRDRRTWGNLVGHFLANQAQCTLSAPQHRSLSRNQDQKDNTENFQTEALTSPPNRVNSNHSAESMCLAGVGATNGRPKKGRTIRVCEWSSGPGCARHVPRVETNPSRNLSTTLRQRWLDLLSRAWCRSRIRRVDTDLVGWLNHPSPSTALNTSCSGACVLDCAPKVRDATRGDDCFECCQPDVRLVVG